MEKNNLFSKLKLFLIAFLLILLSGLILNLVSGGEINILYWMIIPSIVFEEFFKTSYPLIADNRIINLIFVFLFWYLAIYLILNIYVIFKIINTEETKGRNK